MHRRFGLLGSDVESQIVFLPSHAVLRLTERTLGSCALFRGGGRTPRPPLHNSLAPVYSGYAEPAEASRDGGTAGCAVQTSMPPNGSLCAGDLAWARSQKPTHSFWSFLFFWFLRVCCLLFSFFVCV